MMEFLLQLFALFTAEPKPIHFAYIAGGRERVDILLFHPGKQFTELFVAEKYLKFNTFFSAVSTDNLIEGTAAMEMVDDEVADSVMLFRHDADPFALAQSGSEIVHY